MTARCRRPLSGRGTVVSVASKMRNGIPVRERSAILHRADVDMRPEKRKDGDHGETFAFPHGRVHWRIPPRKWPTSLADIGTHRARTCGAQTFLVHCFAPGGGISWSLSHVRVTLV